MPPKKNPMVAPEEVDDIKKALEFLSEEVSAVSRQQKTIMGIVEEVKALRLQNSEKDRRIVLLENRGIELDINNIEACHPLLRRLKTDKPALIIRFANRKSKTARLKQGRRLKGTNVYLNDHLTKKNAEIARKARFLRNQKKIHSTWTTNCKIFIKLNGPPEESKVLAIRNMEDLEKFQ
ncbi:hypothetical protein SKAU_G00215130 [Synaphobranchus kaupii]|uniref:Uncharacterized protein n=1 Tax=Synaphobranchus kaupii TaxID=118154 RepID=A0A9Q1FA92_SYNKA|nr:hypothetical protein SKAU_G00215130 [Synaphobranchus kaupii]